MLVSEKLNKKLKNKQFKEKKKIFQQEGYDLFPDIYDLDEEMAVEVIEGRTEKFGSIAYNKFWKI